MAFQAFHRHAASRTAGRCAAVLASALVLGTAMLAGGARAAEVIGSAETIANQVFGEIERSRRTLAARDPVFRDEVVQTGVQAFARFVFADTSDLRLGANARIRLGSFVYAGQRGTALQLTRGALRFLSGNGPAGSYQIRTPVATIGLRGTGIGIVIASGRTYVTLLNGAAEVCTRGGQCSILDNPCNYVAVEGATVTPQRPLERGVPSFAAVCRGAFCGRDVCGQGTAPSRGIFGGYDPAGGSRSGGDGSGGGGGGKGR